MGQDRGQVAGDVHGAGAVADDDAAGVGEAGGDEGAGLAAAQDDDGGGALELTEGVSRRRFEVEALGEGLGDEVGYDLGVGLGAEVAAALGEAGAQGAVVLDDAVVDDNDVARGVGVGMGVRLGGGAVRRPARVADAGAASRQVVGEMATQVGELADALRYAEAALGVEHGDAGAVVAAVLEAGEALEDDGCGRFAADVTDDSAHGRPSRDSQRVSRAIGRTGPLDELIYEEWRRAN